MAIARPCRWISSEQGRPGSFLSTPHPRSLAQGAKLCLLRYYLAPPLTLSLRSFEVSVCPKLPFIAGVWEGLRGSPGGFRVLQASLQKGVVGAQPLELWESGSAVQWSRCLPCTCGDCTEGSIQEAHLSYDSWVPSLQDPEPKARAKVESVTSVKGCQLLL